MTYHIAWRKTRLGEIKGVILFRTLDANISEAAALQELGKWPTMKRGRNGLWQWKAILLKEVPIDDIRPC